MGNGRLPRTNFEGVNTQHVFKKREILIWKLCIRMEMEKILSSNSHYEILTIWALLLEENLFRTSHTEEKREVQKTWIYFFRESANQPAWKRIFWLTKCCGFPNCFFFLFFSVPKPQCCVTFSHNFRHRCVSQLLQHWLLRFPLFFTSKAMALKFEFRIFRARKEIEYRFSGKWQVVWLN